MTTPTNAVATTREAKMDPITALVKSESFEISLKEVLPSQCDVKRFTKSMLVQIQKNPKILSCTRESVYTCMIELGKLGLDPDGVNAAVIPYGTNLTVQVMYQGYIRLMLNSGDVIDVDAHTICDNDEFDFDTGAVKHRINYRKARGEPYAVYAVFELKSGRKKYRIMTKDEVDDIRKNYSAAGSPAWQKRYWEMAKKTAIKQGRKLLPWSPDMQDKLQIADELDIAEAPQALTRQRGPVTLGTIENKPLEPWQIEAAKENTEKVVEGWKRGKSMHESVPSELTDADQIETLRAAKKIIEENSLDFADLQAQALDLGWWEGPAVAYASALSIAACQFIVANEKAVVSAVKKGGE